MLLPPPPGAAKIAKLNVTLVLCCLSSMNLGWFRHRHTRLLPDAR